MNDFGYKNHVNIDVEHKFIRTYEVTSAAVHDSQVVKQILDPKNTDQEFYADSAYVSPAISQALATGNFQNCIHENGYRNRPLNEEQKASNHRKSAQLFSGVFLLEHS
ncbi:MAG TPA: hypothetical protein DIW81_13505 [Planctomycetaceae bacterium]|nr:hypothetical protein [Rubinisphaera sp.]HCS52586.1 hypothetical protein [Planctomycetaceae bacterium]